MAGEGFANEVANELRGTAPLWVSQGEIIVAEIANENTA
jgi:hypothetical protein